MIDRKMYLDRLISNRERDIIKVVTGVRRCGKSTLFKLYIDYLKSTGVKDDQIISINLEDIEYEAPGSMKLAKSASKAIGDEDVLILKQHGVLCVGDSLKEATLLATFVEETAKTQFITYMLNSTEDLI